MSLIKRWLRQPQTVWFRRALFQVHLWVGIVLGLYLIVISVSGSAVVFRRELSRYYMAPTPVAVTGPRLSEEELRLRAQRAHPEQELVAVYFNKNEGFAAAVSFKRPSGTGEVDRRFNPYTGEDVGPGIPRGMRVLDWFVDLHDNLLAGETGRRINGVGALFLGLLCATGVLIWWPGTKLWARRMVARRASNWRTFNWELHGVVGVWSLSLLLLWTVTGIYFGFPAYFDAAQDYLDTNTEDFDRPGDVLIASLVRWHFGRFGGMPVRILWVVIGLAPAALFITGGIMWWNRVLRRRTSGRPVQESAFQQQGPLPFQPGEATFSRSAVDPPL